MADDTKYIWTKVGYPSQSFTVSLLHKLPRRENLFFSPFSIITAISTVQIGARGNTFSEISKALKTTVDDDFYEAYKTYFTIINTQYTDVILKSANRVYIKRDGDILPSFAEHCATKLLTTPEFVDFQKSEEVRTNINTWVEEQTNQKIAELLPIGSLDPSSSMVLVNALYFKGSWEKPFDKDMTRKMTFHSPKGRVEVDMMYQMHYFHYLKDRERKFSVLELPYRGNTLSMVIVLPHKVKGLESLEKKLSPKDLITLSNKLIATKVKIWIPKFKLDYSSTLKTSLISLGMKEAFDRSKANFTGIHPNNELYVDEVFHRAYVEVNEEGTEAASATGCYEILKGWDPPPPDPEFKVDHPFLFFIKEEANGVIIFAGRVVDPTEEVVLKSQTDRQEICCVL